MIRMIIISVIFCALFGCGTSKKDVDMLNPSKLPVYFLDDRVSKTIAFIDHRAQRLPSGHLSIVFTCRGEGKKKPIVFDWRASFFDKGGMPMDETEWHQEYISPGEIKKIETSSIRRDSAAFQIQIRTPD